MLPDKKNKNQRLKFGTTPYLCRPQKLKL